MEEKLDSVIRQLSEIYDKDSEDSYVSIYLTDSIDTKFVKRRIKACRSILSGNELKNFDSTITSIEKHLDNTNDKNIAIFSSKKNNFEKIIKLPVKIENLFIVDSSPYLRPLARVLDEWESYTLVLLNTNSAKIYSLSLGELKDTKKISKDIMNKHKKGGMSQARFNRLRRGSINSFLKEVSEELSKRVDNQMIIAGPGNAKEQFVEILPQNLKEKIVDVLDISFEEEDELIKKSMQLVSENEQRKSNEAVKHLKSEILKDGLAIYGINETLQAVKNGQVELLIIEKDYKISGWICEKCQYVEEGYKKTCPYCNNETSKVDILEEILEFAERTDAEIEFTDSDEIKDLGHIAGILRYK